MALRSACSRCFSRGPAGSRAFVFSATRPSQLMSKEGENDLTAAAVDVKKTNEEVREKANLAAATIIGKAVQAGPAVAEKAKDLTGKAKDAAQGVWEAAKGTTANVGEAVSDKASDAKGTAEKAAGTVKGTADRAAGAAKDTADKATDTVKGAFNK